MASGYNVWAIVVDPQRGTVTASNRPIRCANMLGQTSRSARPVVYLACSSGGHIELLLRLRDALPDFDHVWVTQPSERARALMDAGERAILLPEYSRNPLEGQTLKALRQSAAASFRERPRLVVTAGSGLVVPFCLLARANGSRIVFVETAARVYGPSKSGRVLSRAAHSTIVQWESMLDVYPGSRLGLASVMDTVRSLPAKPGTGTFVGVGNHIDAFDRLLRLVDDAVERNLLPGPILAQTGVSTYRPRSYEGRAWLKPHEVDAAVIDSRYVITHGGSGFISAALKAGHRPLVLARRQDQGEHFDDHQAQLVGELTKLDLVVELGERIEERQLESSRRPLAFPPLMLDVPPISEVLRAEITRVLA